MSTSASVRWNDAGLSSTMVSIRWVDSRISGPLIRSPSARPAGFRPSAPVGVARPSRRTGHAMIRTSTAEVNANDVVCPVRARSLRVATVIVKTIATKMPQMWSASRWTGALPIWPG